MLSYGPGNFSCPTRTRIKTYVGRSYLQVPHAVVSKVFKTFQVSRASEWAGSSAWYAGRQLPGLKNVRFARAFGLVRPEGRGFKSRPVHQQQALWRARSE